jgi:hypothetical protein
MTELLRKAFDRASTLPDSEQDALANWLLRELEAETRWADALASSSGRLSTLAAEARREYRADRTEPLDPDSM